MTFVHTSYGPGEIIAEDTVRGRKSFQIQGSGFKIWVDAANVRMGASTEPTLHVNEDNSVDLPYNPSTQFPVEMFNTESTIQPNHEIDADERLRSSDSLTFKKAPERKYPGPNPDLFAKSAKSDDYWDDKSWQGDQDPYSGNEDFGDEGPLEPGTDTPWADLPHERYRDHHQAAGAGGAKAPHIVDIAGPSAMGPGLTTQLGANPENDQGKGGPVQATASRITSHSNEYEEPGGYMEYDHAPTQERPPDDYHDSRFPPGDNYVDMLHQDRYHRSAGLSNRYIQVEADIDHYNPIQQFRDDPVGFISKRAYLNSDDHVDIRLAEYMDLIRYDPQTRKAAWNDVRAKAVRLQKQGCVNIKDVGPERIYATVQGDEGVYETMIAKGAGWSCSCDWGKLAFQRKARLCSHAYAAALVLQAASVDDFKTWVKDDNDGRTDIPAMTNYIGQCDASDDEAGSDTQVDEDDAQKLHDYVDGHESEQFERKYDIPYTNDPNDVFKQGYNNYPGDDDIPREDLENTFPFKGHPAPPDPHVHGETEQEPPYGWAKDLGDMEGDSQQRWPKHGEALRLRPDSLTPDFLFAADPEEPQSGIDVEKDERKTTGPEQIVHFSQRMSAEERKYIYGDMGPDTNAPGNYNPQTGRDNPTPTPFSPATVAQPTDALGNGIYNSQTGRDNPTSVPLASPIEGGGEGASVAGSQAEHVQGGPEAPGGGGDMHWGYPGTPSTGGGPTTGGGPNFNSNDIGPGGAVPADKVGGEPGAAPKENASATAPSIGGGDYKVQAGDTENSIAKSMGTTTDALTKANPGDIGNGDNMTTNNNMIHPGDTFHNPTAAPAAGLGDSADPAAASGIGPAGTPMKDPAAAVAAGDSMGGGSGGPGASMPAPATSASGLTGLPGGGGGTGDTGISSMGKPADPSAGAAPKTSARQWFSSYIQRMADGAAAPSPAPAAPGGWDRTQPVSGDVSGQQPTMGGPVNTAGGSGTTAPIMPVPQGLTGRRRQADILYRFADAAPEQDIPEYRDFDGGGHLLDKLRGLIEDPPADDLQHMDTRNDDIRDVVEDLRDKGFDADNIVASMIRQADAAFNQPGGGDWADLPFEGSGPAPQYWMGSSDDYVDEHEKPHHVDDWHDSDGDILKYTMPKKQKESRYDPIESFYKSGAADAIKRGTSRGGGHSDDAIAGQAQAFLKTAGRNYSFAEQRELEDEQHYLGARNLDGLDLRGTHYLD